MTLDSAALASITTAVTLVWNDYLKGLATEAGKATWAGIRSILGWKEDPPAEEAPAQIAEKLRSSPELAENILQVLKTGDAGSASALVGKIESGGGKVVVAQTIVTDHFQM
jgi:hypothetical protein